jgi:hypothetical protein
VGISLSERPESFSRPDRGPSENKLVTLGLRKFSPKPESTPLSEPSTYIPSPTIDKQKRREVCLPAFCGNWCVGFRSLYSQRLPECNGNELVFQRVARVLIPKAFCGLDLG